MRNFNSTNTALGYIEAHYQMEMLPLVAASFISADANNTWVERLTNIDALHCMYLWIKTSPLDVEKRHFYNGMVFKGIKTLKNEIDEKTTFI